MTKFHSLIETMKKKGYKVQSFATVDAAKKAVISLVGDKSVGFAGSMTLDGMGIYEDFKQTGNDVFWHWKNDEEARGKSLTADFYITSTNALTTRGQLVNIDGRGNRVATMILAKRLIVIVGKNKIVEGGIEDAVARIKQYACGQNAKRLGAKVPCANTFTCVDCNSPERICRVTSIMEEPMIGGQEIHIFLVDQNLGY